jgi:hypothetical protein
MGMLPVLMFSENVTLMKEVTLNKNIEKYVQALRS